MGYFNSHSQSWEYDHIDARGEEIEAWQDDKTSHSLINRMTHRLSTPDAGTLPVHLTSHLHSITMRGVGHRPAYQP